MSQNILIHRLVDTNGYRSISLLHAEIVHSAGGEIWFSFEVVSRTSFRSGDLIISAAQFHAWSCQSGLMVSRWNVRCLSDSSTDIYEVRTPHDIRSIHAIYLIAFLFASNTIARLSVSIQCSIRLRVAPFRYNNAVIKVVPRSITRKINMRTYEFFSLMSSITILYIAVLAIYEIDFTFFAPLTLISYKMLNL